MRKFSYAICGALLLPALGVAQSKFADPAAVTPPASGVSSVSYVTLALVFVLALVYGAAWLLKRVKTFQRGAQQNLDVLEAVSVGPKERAVLVRVKDRHVLLGVAPGRVNLLVDLGPQPDTHAPPTDHATPSGSPTPPSFKTLLKRSMGLS